MRLYCTCILSACLSQNHIRISSMIAICLCKCLAHPSWFNGLISLVGKVGWSRFSPIRKHGGRCRGKSKLMTSCPRWNPSLCIRLYYRKELLTENNCLIRTTKRLTSSLQTQDHLLGIPSTFILGFNVGAPYATNHLLSWLLAVSQMLWLEKHPSKFRSTCLYVQVWARIFPITSDCTDYYAKNYHAKWK